KGVARHGKIEDVALPDAAIADAGVVEPATGDSQHLAAEIDPETTLDLGAEQFKNAARPGAEIEQGTKRPVQQQGADIPLDRIIGSVKPADAIPLHCVAAEIVLRGLDPSGPHAGEPFAVARNDRIGRIEGADEIFGDGSRWPMLGAAEKCPRTLAETLDQLRL